jgi:hypothetical protein
MDQVDQEFERKLKLWELGELYLNHSTYIYSTSNNNFHNIPIFHQ